MHLFWLSSTFPKTKTVGELTSNKSLFRGTLFGDLLNAARSVISKCSHCSIAILSWKVGGKAEGMLANFGPVTIHRGDQSVDHIPFVSLNRLSSSIDGLTTIQRTCICMFVVIILCQ